MKYCRKKKIYGGAINKTGSTACIISPAFFGEENEVTKLFIMKKGLGFEDENQSNLNGYRSETNPNLLHKLNEIDANYEKFFYATKTHFPIIDLNKFQKKTIKTCLGEIVKNTGCLIFYNMPIGIPYDESYVFTQYEKNYIKQNLDLLHEHRISHGDIHFRNFVKSPTDINPRIIDFGMSKYPCTDEDISDDRKMFLELVQTKRAPEPMKRRRQRSESPERRSRSKSSPRQSPRQSPRKSPRQSPRKLFR